MDIVMKCCGCNKEINLKISYKDGQPTWYGKYQGSICVKVICRECITDPEKKEEYLKQPFLY